MTVTLTPACRPAVTSAQPCCQHMLENAVISMRTLRVDYLFIVERADRQPGHSPHTHQPLPGQHSPHPSGFPCRSLLERYTRRQQHVSASLPGTPSADNLHKIRDMSAVAAQIPASDDLLQKLHAWGAAHEMQGITLT